MAHEEDNIDTSMVAVVGVISAGISFALIFLLMVLYHSFDNAQVAVEERKPHEEAERLMNQQRAILNESAWVNQQTGQVRIPVSKAMDLVVDQLSETPDDAGVNPPEFTEADATIADPSKVLPKSDAEDPAQQATPGDEKVPADETKAEAESEKFGEVSSAEAGSSAEDSGEKAE